MLIHSPPGTHFCRYCIKIFDNAAALGNHLPECIRSKTGNPFDCIICKKSFNTDDSFRAHVQSKHNPNNKKFKCEICGRHFAQQSALEKHYASHDKAAQHPCDYCGRIFPRSDALKCHKVRMHSEPGTHYCTVCCRIFGTAAELSEHKSVCGSRRKKQLEFNKHIDENASFECYICRRSFTRPSALRGHFRLKHSSEAIRFKCTICDKGFSTKFVLDNHTRCHYKSVNDRKLMCSVCGKYLSTNDSLQNHMLVHSGDKPFACPHDECNKHFRNKITLAEHIRTHTGALFPCTIDGCDQGFLRRRDLKRHKFTIHGIFTKKFPCTICGQIFPEKTLLKAHMKTHNFQA